MSVMDKFLTAIEENSDIVETATFCEVLETMKPSGRIYLPRFMVKTLFPLKINTSTAS